MPQATELGTDNFVSANLGCCEMERKVEAGHEILLHTQFGHKERMAHVLAVHQQVDLPVHRNGHLGGYDVVLGIGIVVRVNAKKVLVGFAKHLRMNGSKCSVRPGVTEVKSKLPSLNLHRYGISCWRLEINIRPGLDSEEAQGQNLGTHKKKRSPHHPLGAAGNIIYFVAGL